MGAPEKTTEASLQRVQRELTKLQRRHIKLEVEREHEPNEDTKDLLRKFLRTDLKIPKKGQGKYSVQYSAQGKCFGKCPRIYIFSGRLEEDKTIKANICKEIWLFDLS